MARHASTSSPVNGSVPLALGASDDEVVVLGAVSDVVLAEAGGVVVVAAGLLGAVVAGVVEAWELVVVVAASGSMYCWSPADVPVPDASADAVRSSPSVASASEQARIWRQRRTCLY